MYYTEQEIIIPSAYPLAATLALPQQEQEKHPMIIMIHGSGDIDRNGNAKQLHINAFKELSDRIAAAGFAVLRYDKRGVGQSGGDFHEMGLFDLIDDAAAVVDFAKQHPQIDSSRIILLGHSEGSIIAPAIHARTPVNGMILLAGTAEPLADTTAWQRKQMKEEIENKKGFSGWLLRLLNVSGKLDKMNNELLQKIHDTDESVITFKGQKISVKWNLEHEQYDVRDYLKKITCPILAITGTKDVQVHPEHAEQICRTVQGECEHYLIPEMTHILRKTDVTKEFSVILKDYKRQIKRPVDQELSDRIVTWLHKHFSCSPSQTK